MTTKDLSLFQFTDFKNIVLKGNEDIILLKTNVKTAKDAEKWKLAYCKAFNTCLNVCRTYATSRSAFHKRYKCIFGEKTHTGKKKTFLGCTFTINIRIKLLTKSTVRKDKELLDYPCFITIQGQHKNCTTSTAALKQLRLLPEAKEEVMQYFSIGMNPTQVYRHLVLKMNLSDGVYKQTSSICPTKRGIIHLWTSWRKKEGLGLNSPSICEAVQNLANLNLGLVVKLDYDHKTFIIVVITPFMMKAHKHLKEAGEVVFVDTSCINKCNKRDTYVIPFLSAGPGGAVPLALVFTSSKDEATLIKGFGMLKEALGGCAFYGRGEPQCFMIDSSEVGRKALATIWPKSKLLLSIFSILQEVWHWLLDFQNNIEKENRQEFMDVMTSLVYASSNDEFTKLWSKVKASSLLEKYSDFKSYLITLVKRKEEWAVAYREGSMLQGYHMNNYAESAMYVIKDTLLNRYRKKITNIMELLVFMVEIFDSYIRLRLVDVALCREQVKSITVDKISMHDIKSIGGGLYTVQSDSELAQVYEVDLTIGMCTCINGENGVLCKHQVACADYGMTAGPQHFDMTTNSLEWLVVFADGVETSSAPKEIVFVGSHENENELADGTEVKDIDDVSIGLTEDESEKERDFEDATEVKIEIKEEMKLL